MLYRVPRVYRAVAVEVKISIWSRPQFSEVVWLLSTIHSQTIFLLLIGQKARNLDSDWFVPLSDDKCPTTAIYYIGHCLVNDFAGRLRKNKVLNEPIRYEEIVVFIKLYLTTIAR